MNLPGIKFHTIARRGRSKKCTIFLWKRTQNKNGIYKKVGTRLFFDSTLKKQDFLL